MEWSVQPFVDVLREYVNNPGEVAVRDAAQLEQLVTSLNRAQLQNSGTDNQSRVIRPAYTRRTVQIKRAKGQPTNRVTLRDTGDFHDSIKADFTGDEITLSATDPKTRELLAKYGPEVLGLDDASVDLLTQRLLPIMQAELRKRLAR